MEDFLVKVKPEYIIPINRGGNKGESQNDVSSKVIRDVEEQFLENVLGPGPEERPESEVTSLQAQAIETDVIAEELTDIVEGVKPINSDKADDNIDNSKDTNNTDAKDKGGEGGGGGGRNKKRPRDNRVSQKDRMCSSVKNGSKCQFGDTCPYSHDPLEFLAKKGPDIGNVCYQYEQLGWCQNGVSCRFGACHIDKATGDNLTRSIEEGGMRDKVHINILQKPLQILLRKKKYDFSKTSKAITSPITIVKAGTLTADDNNDADIAVGAEDIKEVTTVPYNDIEKSKSEGDSVTSTVTVALNADIPGEPLHASAGSSHLQAQGLLDFSPYAQFVKIVDFSNKVYVAPLTTVGNLPFRRVLQDFGADITCGEMAMANNLLQGQASEWALLRRHSSERDFGIQIAAGNPDQMHRLGRLLENETSSSFIDLNCGCPLDVVCNRGCGSSLMNKPNKLVEVVKTMASTLPSRSITVKIRTGWDEKNPNAHKIVPMLQKISNGRIAAIMIHGRSRLQRYHRLANWDYIFQAAQSQTQDGSLPTLPIIGNGDILSYEDWASHRSYLRSRADGALEETLGLCNCAMLGRGALTKPWLPTEIKENRHFDISASERLDMLKAFCNYGLEHWGSDTQGVNTTRRFLLEWLSFLYRYVPVGITYSTQKINQRPPLYFGRDDLETLLASGNSNDWVRISVMLLGPVGEDFHFMPKHKSNSYSPECDVSNG